MTAREVLLIDAVRRLLDLDERRHAVVLSTAEDDIEEGVARTVPIMAEYKLVILELR